MEPCLWTAAAWQEPGCLGGGRLSSALLLFSASEAHCHPQSGVLSVSCCPASGPTLSNQRPHSPVGPGPPRLGHLQWRSGRWPGPQSRLEARVGGAHRRVSRVIGGFVSRGCRPGSWLLVGPGPLYGQSVCVSPGSAIAVAVLVRLEASHGRRLCCGRGRHLALCPPRRFYGKQLAASCPGVFKSSVTARRPDIARTSALFTTPILFPRTCSYSVCV